MANTGRQSPLSVNILGSLLQDSGLTINSTVKKLLGTSKTNTDYVFGTMVQETVLRLLTWAINDGYIRGVPNGGSTVNVATYNNLISIGADSVPALGNSKPASYRPLDPANIWARTTATSVTQSISEKYGTQQSISPSLPGPATAGYSIASNTGQGQEATWYPYTGDSSVNPNTAITQWGWLRCHALQAWNEFNYNGDNPTQSNPEYAQFINTFMTTHGFAMDSNQTINVVQNSNTFLDGVYSNMNDLTSGDVTGVNLSTIAFGTDCMNLGKAVDLSQIETFGRPSNLLINIGKAGALTQDLALALLSAGITKDDISSITNGILPNYSKQLEQAIFGAFLLIRGENLIHVLAPLQVKTDGLTTLADLLNLQKMFPLSYASMTVPVYNGVMGLPTNSKTYYLIYNDSGLNPDLNNPVLQDYIGTIIPNEAPPIYESTSSPDNYVDLPKGFGSYLDGILPSDWATANGAFSYSMRQIKNIQSVNFLTFAKVAMGIEVISDLPLVNGTSKPTDQTAIDASKTICALGSGPNGGYTMSDFFGSMSGLPYPFKLIDQRIRWLQTDTLANIYQQLFLAVTWEQATVDVTYTTYTVGPTTFYTVTGFTITDPGGGYGRGNAPAPTITVSNGATATVTIGTDDSSAGSNGQGTFGRVINVALTNPGTDGTTIPTAQIQAPPTSTLGGTNTAFGTAGWPSMNTVVQNYIDLANAEIQNITITNKNYRGHINDYWQILGQQLAREQRSRYKSLNVVSIPKDLFNSGYPNNIYTFIDSFPVYAVETQPNMSAQTLEAISDTDTLGGQSIIAKLREERNQARLQRIGIDLDNNIPNNLSMAEEKALIANGTLPTPGDGITGVCGTTYTLPAWPDDVEPIGYYVPGTGFQSTASTQPGDITPILDCVEPPVVNTVVPSGPVIVPSSPIDDIVIIQAANDYNPDNLPPNLDPNYYNSTMRPSSLSVQQAIDNVVKCNCDCWIQ